MNSQNSDRSHPEAHRISDEDRVNYWLNYISDIDEETSHSEGSTSGDSVEAIEPINSEPIQPNSSKQLETLEEILVGKSEDSSGYTDDFNLLQDILVRPETLEFRERIGNLEKQCEALENRNDAEDLVRLLLPLISKLLNRKLARLKQEIVEEIEPLIEGIIEDREEKNEREQHLSIRVIGIQKETPSTQNANSNQNAKP